jgi:hypothetical protein
MPEKDFLKAFKYDLASGHVEETPFLIASGERYTKPPTDGMPGGFSSISANGMEDGIVWTSMPNGDGQGNPVAGILAAFDASNLNLLWYDGDPVLFAKSVPPTIADGKVIRATAAGQVIVYGLIPPSPCPNGGDVNACGGCNVLLETPSMGCRDRATGKCGRFRCVGTESVTCDINRGLPNACGGCGFMPLPAPGPGSGSRCICNDPARDEGILVCSADKNHLICCPCHSAPGCGLDPP